MVKIKLAITLTVIFVTIIGGLYWIAGSASKEKADRILQVNKEYKYARGVIVKKTSYKGHSIDIKYQIENKDYKCTGGWDSNLHNLGEGDSITFRYAVDNPALIITGLEAEY